MSFQPILLSTYAACKGVSSDTLHEIMEVPSATNINKNRLYKGKVVDDRTSEPLVGATVKVKGSTIGTITDIDGNFALDIPDNISPIVFEVSYMGYASKEAAPAKTTGFTIRLAEDSQTLEEVQIIAYGKQSKMSVTAAISSIDTKELLKSPSGSVANALYHRFSGYTATRSDQHNTIRSTHTEYSRGSRVLQNRNTFYFVRVHLKERTLHPVHQNQRFGKFVRQGPRATYIYGRILRSRLTYSVCVERMVLCWSLRVAVYPENR